MGNRNLNCGIYICCGTIPILSKYLISLLFQKEQASRNVCLCFDELNVNFLIRETEKCV